MVAPSHHWHTSGSMERWRQAPWKGIYTREKQGSSQRLIPLWKAVHAHVLLMSEEHHRETADFFKLLEITGMPQGIAYHSTCCRMNFLQFSLRRQGLHRCQQESSNWADSPPWHSVLRWEQRTESDTASGAAPVPAIKESASLPVCIWGRAAGGLSQLPISWARISELQHGGRKVGSTCVPGQG